MYLYGILSKQILDIWLIYKISWLLGYYAFRGQPSINRVWVDSIQYELTLILFGIIQPN